MSKEDVQARLRERGLRSTPARVALLSHLARAAKPLTADDIHRKLDADLVTVYRNLQALVQARLVRELRFNNAVGFYEIADSSKHHHHLVCTKCGIVSELPECDMSALDTHVLGQVQEFASVSEHMLEFLGVCRTCARV